MQSFEGKIFIYHFFTIANEIDLEKLRTTWSGQSSLIQLKSLRASSSYIQFSSPPLLMPLGTQGLYLDENKQINCQVNAKIFEFGVVSLCWELPLPQNWNELKTNSLLYVDNLKVAEQSENLFTSLKPTLETCLHKPHSQTLIEDYTIFHIYQFDQQSTHALQILKQYGSDIAQLIRGEKVPLSESEKKVALKNHINYFEHDLVVVDWNASFIYDPEQSREHIDILEFANSELVELRYYDDLLDQELEKIYDEIGEQIANKDSYFAQKKYSETSKKLLTLLIDVMDITDRLENTLKVIGDLYCARIYRAISERLRLKDWQERIDSKLDAVRQIYATLNDGQSNRRFQVMELTIIILIAVEIVILLWEIWFLK